MPSFGSKLSLLETLTLKLEEYKDICMQEQDSRRTVHTKRTNPRVNCALELAQHELRTVSLKKKRRGRTSVWVCAIARKTAWSQQRDHLLFLPAMICYHRLPRTLRQNLSAGHAFITRQAVLQPTAHVQKQIIFRGRQCARNSHPTPCPHLPLQSHGRTVITKPEWTSHFPVLASNTGIQNQFSVIAPFLVADQK